MNTRVAAGALALLALAAGCAPAAPPPGRAAAGPAQESREPAATGPAVPASTGSTGLRRFRTCEELSAHMRALTLPYVTAYGFGRSGQWDPNRGRFSQMTDGLVSAPRPDDGQWSLSRDRTDFPDPTDGRLLVWRDGLTLRVADVSGTPAVPLGTLDLSGLGFNPSRLILTGKRALVLGESGETGLAVVDLADPRRPRLLSSSVIGGNLRSVRLVGGRIEVTVASAPELAFRAPSDPDDEAAALAHNRRVVEGAPASTWLPTLRAVGPAGQGEARPLLRCSDVWRPGKDSGHLMLTALSLDLAGDDLLPGRAPVGVVADTGTAYVSGERLWLATYPGAWGRAVVDELKGRVEVTGTVIHALDTSGRVPRHLGSRELAGWVPGEWAMSEHDADLRVFRFEPGFPDEGPSAILTLRPAGGTLRRVAAVEQTDRQIHQVGWLGSRLVLTAAARRDDSVRVADLAAAPPAAPGVLAGVSFAQYADYAELVDGRTILTVTRGPESDGPYRLQIRAHDVRNPAQPRSTGALVFAPWSGPGGPFYVPAARTLVVPAYFRAKGRHQHVVTAVRVGEDGSLTETASWRPTGGGRWLIPLGDDRLAAVRGDRVTILDAATLRPDTR